MIVSPAKTAEASDNNERHLLVDSENIHVVNTQAGMLGLGLNTKFFGLGLGSWPWP